VRAPGWSTARASLLFSALNTAQADAFIACWSDLLISVVLVQDPDTRLLTPATALLSDRYNSGIDAYASQFRIPQRDQHDAPTSVLSGQPGSPRIFRSSETTGPVRPKIYRPPNSPS